MRRVNEDASEPIDSETIATEPMAWQRLKRLGMGNTLRPGSSISCMFTGRGSFGTVYSAFNLSEGKKLMAVKEVVRVIFTCYCAAC